MKNRPVLFAPVVLILLAFPAAAQTGSFLQPQIFQVEQGSGIKLTVSKGTPAKSQAATWPAGQIEWFYVRVAGTQENRDSVKPAAQGQKFITWPADHLGETLIGLDTKPTVQNVTLDKFKKILADANTASSDKDTLSTAAQPLRLAIVESMKTVVNVVRDGAQTRSMPVSVSKTAQAAEIRLLADPFRIRTESDLPFRTYVDGAKLANARVFATSPKGVRGEIKTDPMGIGNLDVKQAGVWLLEFWHVRPARGDERAQFDFLAHHATYVFEIPEGGAQ